MLLGIQQKRHRLFFLPLMMITLILAGCSLSAPAGGGANAEQTTFEGAPIVRIFSPLPNQTFLEGTTVNIQARVENAGADIAKVSIYLDDALVGEQVDPNAIGASAFSVTIDWVTSNQGQYEIAVIAERGDGTASDRETVSVSVIKQATVGNANATSSDTQNTATDSPTVENNPPPTQDNTASSGSSTSVPPPPTTVPTSTPQLPTNTPEPTATFTPSVPMAVVINGANLRRGPGTVFEPPVGSIAANQEAELVAVNPARDWYKIRYFNSTAWIFASLVQTSGDVSSLPVDAGPPTPIPATATPIPPTPTETPIPNPVNLYVVNIAIDPHPLKCQKTSQIQVTVGNNGTSNAESGGKILVEAVLVSSGAVLESTVTIFGPIAAGAQATASASITVGTNFDELQRIRVTVDIDGQVAESNENDNTTDTGTDYILKKGNC
jgi:CARDB/Bacterial Ig domain